MTKILVERDGVVRVTDAALTAAGTAVAGREVDRLRLTLKGAEVPLRISWLPAGSTDGRFALEFLGAFPRGKKTYEDEFTVTSAYVLDVAPEGTKPLRPRLERPGAGRSPGRLASPFTAHHEINKKLIRFTGDAQPDEAWFWEEIKATDAAPTRITIHADAVAPGAATLKVRFVGYSHLPQHPDHTVDVSWNGTVLGKAAWDGEAAFVFEKVLPEGTLKEGDNALSLRALGENTGGIDLVLLDWVELAYTRRHHLASGGQCTLQADAEGARINGAGSGRVTVWDLDGPRIFELAPDGGGATFVPPAATRAGRYRAVRADGAYPPHGVLVTHPADLWAAGLGADFIIVSHEKFLPAAERLATARRAEGLETAVVAVGDVYDRFSDGFFDPEALHRFLKHAWSTWSPRPRYVLFVGDASWDYKNATASDADYADWHWSPEMGRQVWKNGSTPYKGSTAPNDRLFVPTFQYQSPWGHAASDHHFAILGEGGDRADIAVGRLPVASLAEANAIVDKILSYERLKPGELKDALFITNDEEGFQRQTDQLVEAAAKEGYAVQRVYPKKEEKDNLENTKALQRAFDAGPAFVLFNGHGGRYVWRTGPPDITKNHDLFTLEHLDALHETKGLPVVVSLTCYSAPFDHPVADSIGEKLLRIDHKGAIAVIASSWRNSPPIELGRRLIDLLGETGHERIGDAFLSAKQSINDRVALYTYNLLGDPTTHYRGPVPLLTSKGQPQGKEGTDGASKKAP
jgi:Peptidase family C25